MMKKKSRKKRKIKTKLPLNKKMRKVIKNKWTLSKKYKKVMKIRMNQVVLLWEIHLESYLISNLILNT